jgi:phytoene/squalene synthetase
LSGQGRQQRLQLYYSFRFCRKTAAMPLPRCMPFVAKWTMWWMNATTRAWPAKLAWWRGEVEKLYHGQPEHPVMLALKPHVTVLDLPQNLLEEIVDGMQMDLDFARYDRFQDLLLYCHRVAGVVGQLAAQIFGYQDRQTLKYAHELGIAFQLTNIIRDVGEDARRAASTCR